MAATEQEVQRSELRWAVAVSDDGQVLVDKSKKFQQERGEWNNPESFINT